jgi:hypothetical protein
MTALNITLSGPLATVALNRPEVRNAFNDEVIAGSPPRSISLAGTTRCVPLCWPQKAPPFARVLT